MDALDELIELNREIVKQNDIIIDLLKKMVPESEDVVESESSSDLLLKTSFGVGEVNFISNDKNGEVGIYSLAIKNNEIMIDNLNGCEDTSKYNLAKLIAITSIEKNQSVKDNSCIIEEYDSLNLPNILKTCVESGAENVYLPISATKDLLYAPHEILSILNLVFYKNDDDLLENIF